MDQSQPLYSQWFAAKNVLQTYTQDLTTSTMIFSFSKQKLIIENRGTSMSWGWHNWKAIVLKLAQSGSYFIVYQSYFLSHTWVASFHSLMYLKCLWVIAVRDQIHTLTSWSMFVLSAQPMGGCIIPYPKPSPCIRLFMFPRLSRLFSFSNIRCQKESLHKPVKIRYFCRQCHRVSRNYVREVKEANSRLITTMYNC